MEGKPEEREQGLPGVGLKGLCPITGICEIVSYQERLLVVNPGYN